MPIHFHNEDIIFRLPKPRKTTGWIKSVAEASSFRVGTISYIFCSDAYLLKINQEFLNHNTFTDIVTFDHSEEEGLIEGDIFISIDRVRDNAERLQQSFQEELHRVIIHGILHLMGYGDKDKKSKQKMRAQEDACLSLPSVPRETF